MNTSRVLLVEDEDFVARIIEHTLAGDDIKVKRCVDAESAWQELEGHGTDFGAILLDRQLPGMDGMTLLRQIKKNPVLRNIPVIMETVMDGAESIREGIAAGAYYYMTKPMLPKLLLAVVNAALGEHRQFIESQAAVQEAGKALLYLESGVFHCRTLIEARDLANVIARGCPNPERVVPGLQELLENAVEHGNLGISYNDKTRLVIDGQWKEEIERRLMLPEYRERTVTVTLTREATNLLLTIQDQGDGFSWQRYLDFDPERAFDPHGRGIAMARAISFDAIEYQGNGNSVILKIADSRPK